MKLLNLFTGRRETAEASEIAENGADKVLFKSEQNSNVRKRYMNFVGAQKRAVDAPLYAISGGRSMVEMLGVLAIIGILSVGAMTGYNTAMYKHRMNKTIQAFTDLLQNLAELSTKDWGRTIIETPTQYVKYGFLPASMCPEDYVSAILGERGVTCKLPLGEFSAYFGNELFLWGEFDICFYEGDIVKSCVDFLSHGWQNMYPQDWLKWGGSFIAVVSDQNQQFLWAEQPERVGGGKKDITLNDIQNACDICKGSEYCLTAMGINAI